MAQGYIKTAGGNRIDYEHREDVGWFVTDGVDDAPFRFATPNADERTVTQLLRKEFDEDY